MKINKSKCGILNKTKENIPLELQNYPIVDKNNPYKYLGIEMNEEIAKDNYCSRIKLLEMLLFN